MCKKHLMSRVMVACAFIPTLLCEFEASCYTEKSSRKSKTKAKRKRKGKKLYWFVQENVLLGFFLKVLKS